MKKIFLIILVFCMTICLFACEQEPVAVPMATKILSKDFTQLAEQSISPKELIPGSTFTCGSRDVMDSYYNIDENTLYGVCRYFEEQGYEQYSYHEMNGNLFSTYVKGAGLVHVMWFECEKRMTIVTSETNGAFLPPKMPEIRTGSTPTTVTQLKSLEINGMGYLIQLADGSFIVYDSGNLSVAQELKDAFKDLTPKGQKPVVRAWLFTHGHGDHCDAFREFADKYADSVTVERFLYSPANVGSSYLLSGFLEDVAKFDGAEGCPVYTGMVFTICNVRLEILITYEEEYAIGSASKDFNNTSIVSRVYTDDYSAIFLGDAGDDCVEKMAVLYGDYLKSDMCQISHHGVEDCPLVVYRHIRAGILWYPCSQSLYNLPDRDAEVRKALAASKYTKEIIIHESRETREFGE